MTLPEELVKAATNAPCLRYPEDFKCGEGHNLSDSDDRQHPECVAAAVLRALPESETVIAAARRAAVAKHGTLIGSLPEVLADAILAAIAKLADDV